MGRARNQRSKAEGSFLESVQKALQRLQGDLCYIKATVAELKHAPEARQQDKQHMINVGESPATGWDDWDAWNNLGFFDDGIVKVQQYGTFWNTNADTFVPITATDNDVFSKAGLLSLRGPLSPDVPDEMAGLSARNIGDDSPPCDDSSLGSDTSLHSAHSLERACMHGHGHAAIEHSRATAIREFIETMTVEALDGYMEDYQTHFMDQLNQLKAVKHVDLFDSLDTARHREQLGFLR